MSNFQKIIKYFAIAFAMLLIVTIVSGICSLGYTLLSSFGLVKDKNILDKNIVISDDVSNLSSLKIDIKSAQLDIVKDDKFKVETNNSNIKYDNKNGNVSVIENSKINFGSRNDIVLKIYLPRDIYLDDFNISTGAGKISIESIDADTLECNFGAGVVSIDKLNISKKANIEAGVGELVINGGNINDLKLELGIGDSKVNLLLTGDSTVKTGIGKLDLSLLSSIEDYKIKVNKGLGSIKVNGTTALDGSIIGDGNNSLSIEAGIGDVYIKTR